MTVKELMTAVFGSRRRRVRRVPITPEFGVRVMLREGDRLVYRDPDGALVVKTIVRGAERGL